MVNQLRPLGYSDQQIGLIGLVSIVVQCVGAVVIGAIAGHMKTKMKLIIITLLSVSALGFLWLLVMCLPSSPLPHSLPTLYLAIIIATGTSGSSYSLFFEMAAEMAYPVGEGTVAAFLSTMSNLVAMVFLFLFFIPSLSSGRCLWMSYSLVGSSLLAIPATWMIQGQYHRTTVDSANK